MLDSSNEGILEFFCFETGSRFVDLPVLALTDPPAPASQLGLPVCTSTSSPFEKAFWVRQGRMCGTGKSGEDVQIHRELFCSSAQLGRNGSRYSSLLRGRRYFYHTQRLYLWLIHHSDFYTVSFRISAGSSRNNLGYTSQIILIKKWRGCWKGGSMVRSTSCSPESLVSSHRHMVLTAPCNGPSVLLSGGLCHAGTAVQVAHSCT